MLCGGVLPGAGGARVFINWGSSRGPGVLIRGGGGCFVIDEWSGEVQRAGCLIFD